MHYTGLETFELPNNKALIALTVNAVIGTVISDYAWARSVVLMGPLLTTLGIALTIPISMIVDAIFISKKQYNWFFYVGCSCIIVSFCVMSWLDYKAQLDKEQR